MIRKLLKLFKLFKTRKGFKSTYLNDGDQVTITGSNFGELDGTYVIKRVVERTE